MKSQRGMTLVEVVIAVGVLGIIAVGFMAALSGSTKALIKADQRTTAESLARSQWEYVKSQPYTANFTYQKIDLSDPKFGYASSGYAISMTDNKTLANGLQVMTYVVTYDGKEVLRLTDYKLYR